MADREERGKPVAIPWTTLSTCGAGQRVDVPDYARSALPADWTERLRLPDTLHPELLRLFREPSLAGFERVKARLADHVQSDLGGLKAVSVRLFQDRRSGTEFDELFRLELQRSFYDPEIVTSLSVRTLGNVIQDNTLVTGKVLAALTPTSDSLEAEKVELARRLIPARHFDLQRTVLLRDGQSLRIAGSLLTDRVLRVGCGVDLSKNERDVTVHFGGPVIGKIGLIAPEDVYDTTPLILKGVARRSPETFVVVNTPVAERVSEYAPRPLAQLLMGLSRLGLIPEAFRPITPLNRAERQNITLPVPSLHGLPDHQATLQLRTDPQNAELRLENRGPGTTFLVFTTPVSHEWYLRQKGFTAQADSK